MFYDILLFFYTNLHRYIVKALSVSYRYLQKLRLGVMITHCFKILNFLLRNTVFSICIFC